MSHVILGGLVTEKTSANKKIKEKRTANPSMGKIGTGIRLLRRVGPEGKVLMRLLCPSSQQH